MACVAVLEKVSDIVHFVVMYVHTRWCIAIPCERNSKGKKFHIYKKNFVNAFEKTATIYLVVQLYVCENERGHRHT